LLSCEPRSPFVVRSLCAPSPLVRLLAEPPAAPAGAPRAPSAQQRVHDPDFSFPCPAVSEQYMRYYMPLEYCEQSLDDPELVRLLRLGLPLATILGMFKQLVDGVAFCHERRVCHCDLKPSNVLVAKRVSLPAFSPLALPTLRLCDFGVWQQPGLYEAARKVGTEGNDPDGVVKPVSKLETQSFVMEQVGRAFTFSRSFFTNLARPRSTEAPTPQRPAPAAGAISAPSPIVGAPSFAANFSQVYSPEKNDVMGLGLLLLYLLTGHELCSSNKDLVIILSFLHSRGRSGGGGGGGSGDGGGFTEEDERGRALLLAAEALWERARARLCPDSGALEKHETHLLKTLEGMLHPDYKQRPALSQVHGILANALRAAQRSAEPVNSFAWEAPQQPSSPGGATASSSSAAGSPGGGGGGGGGAPFSGASPGGASPFSPQSPQSPQLPPRLRIKGDGGAIVARCAGLFPEEEAFLGTPLPAVFAGSAGAFTRSSRLLALLRALSVPLPGLLRLQADESALFARRSRITAAPPPREEPPSAAPEARPSAICALCAPPRVLPGDALAAHFASAHAPTVAHFYCGLCERVASSIEDQLVHHHHMHCSQLLPLRLPAACQRCGAVVGASALAAHLLSAHPKLWEEQPAACGLCGVVGAAAGHHSEAHALDARQPAPEASVYVPPQGVSQAEAAARLERARPCGLWDTQGDGRVVLRVGSSARDLDVAQRAGMLLLAREGGGTPVLALGPAGGEAASSPAAEEALKREKEALFKADMERVAVQEAAAAAAAALLPLSPLPRSGSSSIQSPRSSFSERPFFDRQQRASFSGDNQRRSSQAIEEEEGEEEKGGGGGGGGGVPRAATLRKKEVAKTKAQAQRQSGKRRG
jgi:serine/threonine protein kinase